MADILIRGMEMPHNCFQCQLSVLKGERLFCEVTKEEVLRKKLAPECPLHELPEHGDLILKDDAIVAVKLLSDLYPEYRKILAVLWDQIKDLTVIIPESEEVTNDPQP